MRPRLPIFVSFMVLTFFRPLVMGKSTSRPMEGVHFRCCTLIEEPQVLRDSSSKYKFGGIAMEYLAHLESKLGFECSSFTLLEGPGVGFTDFIFNLEKCTLPNGTVRARNPECNCDIGIAGFSMNSERIGRVDFTLPYLNVDFRVVTHIKNTRISMDDAFFLNAFAGLVWLNIVALVAVFTFLKMLDRHVAPAEEFKPLPREVGYFRRFRHYALKSKVPYRLRMAAESTFYHLIGQNTHVKGDRSSQRQRILNFVVLLTGLFLMLVYEAAMTASLVRQSHKGDFRTVNDFKTCRIPPDQVCLPAGGATEALWRKAIATRPCHREQKPTLIPTYEELIAKTASRSCEYSVAGGPTLAQATKGRFCRTLVETGQSFFTGGVSFVLPKGSMWTEVINEATLDLKADGKLPTLQEYLGRQGECRLSEDESLTFAKLRVFFFVAYGVAVLLLLEMLVDPQARLGDDRDKNARTGQNGGVVEVDMAEVNPEKKGNGLEERTGMFRNDDVSSGSDIV